MTAQPADLTPEASLPSQEHELRLFIDHLPENEQDAINETEDAAGESDLDSPSAPQTTSDEPLNPTPSQEDQTPKKPTHHFFLFGMMVAVLSAAFLAGGYFFPLGSFTQKWSSTPSVDTPNETDPGVLFAQQFSSEFDVREKITIQAYRDQNQNNRNDGESGIQGISVNLSLADSKSTVVASATTDNEGKAILYGVKPGKYSARFFYNPAYFPSGIYQSFAAELFQISSQEFPQASTIDRVLPSQSMDVTIEPDKTWEIAIQKYEPKNIVVGSRDNTVIFYDADVKRQIAWFSSQETDLGSLNFWLVGRDVYFLDAAGDVQKYSYKDNSFTKILENPGILRTAGFEFAMLSPGGQSLAYALNTGNGSPLHFASTQKNCSNPTLAYQSKPLFVTTNSNPDDFFPLTWLDDSHFWFGAKDAVGGFDRLYFASCSDNNTLSLTQSSIHSPANDHFYEVMALDDHHVLANGEFIEPDPSSTTGGILRSVRGSGVVKLESGKPDTLYFLGEIRDVWRMNADRTWLAAINNSQVSFYKVSALKEGKVQEVAVASSNWQGSVVWIGDVFYTLSTRECDGMVCNTIQGYRPTDSGVEKVDTFETKNESLNRLLGVIKN